MDPFAKPGRFSATDIDFTRAETERLFVSDEELLELCRRETRQFEPVAAQGMLAVANLIAPALRDGRGLSVIRVGNGEGNALGMTRGPVDPVQEKTFLAEYWSQNGRPIQLADSVPFCRLVRDSIVDADVVGFRSVDNDEAMQIARALDRSDAYAALGLLYARRFLYEGLVEGSLRDRLITSAFIHLEALNHLDALLELAPAVVVVSGRTELEPAFTGRLGDRLVDFVSVPVQGVWQKSEADSHFARFAQLRGRLQRDLRGILVLVGAGLFGKVYCMDAKRWGGVAFDIGSAFDLLAGLSTRPVHARVDIASYRWI